MELCFGIQHYAGKVGTASLMCATHPLRRDESADLAVLGRESPSLLCCV